MRGQGAGFAEAAEAFAVATGLEDSTGNEGFRGLLEKKWTSVVRLQRKVGRRPGCVVVGGDGGLVVLFLISFFREPRARVGDCAPALAWTTNS